MRMIAFVTAVAAIFYGVAMIPMGIMAYCTPTWNLGSTEVLTGWANVGNVALIGLIFVGPIWLGSILIIALYEFATRDE